MLISLLFLVAGLAVVIAGANFLVSGASSLAKRMNISDIAVGNVVGSNIVNVFLILGLSASINPLKLGASANIDISVALLASLLLFLSTFVLNKKVVNRTEGIIFVAVYIVYVVYLIIKG